MIQLINLIEAFASHLNTGGDIQACITLVNNLVVLGSAIEKDVAAAMAQSAPVVAPIIAPVIAPVQSVS